ncbi:MAG: PrpR N-terminal domain-containing protein [Acidaminococcales bacterium]|jgi:transcriptional regulator with PAS, ATPase and Fis domain|nr:PrpR N-terminal domain-containing protein [Acidaminococcales bacterium]
MADILFFLSDLAMLEDAKKALGETYPDIELYTAFSDKALEILNVYAAKGLNVAAARAGTALTIKRSLLKISVVEIPITSFDILRTVHEANLYGKKIAIVTYSEMILGMDMLAEFLKTDIWQYTMKYGQAYRQAVEDAFARDVDVILGGAGVVKAAEMLRIPAVLIKIGKESLLQAAREATQICRALELETAKRDFINTILDYASAGIITTDSKYVVTAFNSVAQNILTIDKAAALGQHIEKVFPCAGLLELLSGQHNECMLDVNNMQVICNKAPVIVKGKIFGYVITIQEVAKIQQMEERIRKKIMRRETLLNLIFPILLAKAPLSGKLLNRRSFLPRRITVCCW